MAKVNIRGPYEKALERAQAEVQRLDKRREVLLRLISDLVFLSDEEHYELAVPLDYVPKGLTEEIRTILRLTTVSLDPVQIRDALMHRGLGRDDPRNLLIAVHTILRRIKDELDVIERGGKPAYKAKHVRVRDTRIKN